MAIARGIFCNSSCHSLIFVRGFIYLISTFLFPTLVQTVSDLLTFLWANGSCEIESISYPV